MRYYLYIIALLLPILAAAKSPNEDDIVVTISNPQSENYYPALKLRYSAGDETLTADNFHYLYYGYAYQDSYKPLATDQSRDKLLLMASTLDIDNPMLQTLEEIIYTGTEALQADPFSPTILNLMAYAYGALGNEAQEAAFYRKMQGVINTIKASGDSFSQKSPQHILMFDHALDLLTIGGYAVGKSRVVSRDVEFIPLVEPQEIDGKKRKGFYFDFSRIYWNKPEGYTYKRDRTWQLNNLKPREYK